MSPVHVERLGFVHNEADFDSVVATAIPQLVFHLGTDGGWTWCGGQWLKFTGLTFEESLGLGWLQAVHPHDQGAAAASWGVANASVHSLQLRIWSKAGEAFQWHLICGRPVLDALGSSSWIGAMTDIHAIVDRQVRQDVVIAELHHRARNLLAVTWGIASRIIKRAESVSAFKRDFKKKIGALSRVQDIAGEDEVGLREILLSQIAALTAVDVNASAVMIDGPPVLLSPKSAQALGLAVHELATNAVKHGAFSTKTGRLSVTWDIDSSAEPKVRLMWKEHGVPIQPDQRRTAGYGTELLTRALPFDLGARTELAFEADGLRCAIELPLLRLNMQRNELAISKVRPTELKGVSPHYLYRGVATITHRGQTLNVCAKRVDSSWEFFCCNENRMGLGKFSSPSLDETDKPDRGGYDLGYLLDNIQSQVRAGLLAVPNTPTGTI